MTEAHSRAHLLPQHGTGLADLPPQAHGVGLRVASGLDDEGGGGERQADLACWRRAVQRTLLALAEGVHDLAAATGRLPHLTSWLAHPAGLPPDEQFGLGLGFLLDGIARCLAGAETQARSDTMGR
jgi:hypothetical protein